MKKSLLLITLSALASLSSAFDFADIKFWAGNGSKQSALVIDFADNGGSAYAWGFRYDGALSGLDMIRAVDAADSSLAFDIVSYSFGDAVNGISYGSLSKAGFVAGSYWSYWNGITATNWISSNVGASDRVLSDGSWDGWSWGDGATTPRANVVAAVPEPSSLLVLGLGLAFFRRRRG